MMQPSLFDLVGRSHPKYGERRKFVDFFCGIGGASQGAAQAGFDVVMAVDSCKEHLRVHKLNHRSCIHVCSELPTDQSLPLPPAEEQWHLHGSPPCTDLSIAKQERNAERKEAAVDLVEWFIRFAVSSNAFSWSMEQVPVGRVTDRLDALMSDPFLRNKFSYAVVDLSQIGVPQLRKRLVAGPKHLVANVKRLNREIKGIVDYIERPRGTHVRHITFHCYEKGNDGRILRARRYGVAERAIPIDQPGYTVTQSSPTWVTPGVKRSTHLMNTLESSLIQTFPKSYKHHKKRLLARRSIGNAFPPLAMQKVLTSML